MGLPPFLDPERIIPISRGSTADAFKTGAWAARQPMFLEKTSPCRAACPNGNDIPHALALAANGDIDGALAVFLEESGLPGVCGNVCYHPCQTLCNRGELDGPVGIRALERAAAEFGEALPKRLSEAGKPYPVAVVGAGPAGLAAAYHLARMGHPVTVHEAGDSAGGLLRFGIPEFRLARSVLNRDLDRFATLGIQIKTGWELDRAGLADLASEYAAVFLAVGASVHQKLQVVGENLPGVVYGLNFLKQPEARTSIKGMKVVVIGGGNSAMDAARTARRLGASDVTVVYRRTREDMPAFAEDVAEAEEEGVALKCLFGPICFLGDKKLEGLQLSVMRIVSGGDGRRMVQPSPCNESTMVCDLAIVAAGQGPDLSALPNDVQLAGSRVWIDSFGRMGAGKTYAGGDLTPVRASVVDAMASGKRAAAAIHFDLLGRDVGDRVRAVTLGEGPSFSIQAMFEPPQAWAPDKVVHLHDMTLASAHPQAPLDQSARPPEERVRDFMEVVAGFDRESAVREADRCFCCGVCVGCDRCFIYCPDASVGRPGEAGGEYRVLTEFCKGCGICTVECVRGVMQMEEGG